MSLEKKVVIVTGAGSGIGAATAKHFAKQGAQVIVSDINKENANNIFTEIIEADGDAETIIANVSTYSDVQNLINQVVKQYGQLDVMVNNAGIGNKQLLKTAEHTLEDWENVIAVNQTGVFYCMKTALTQMSKQGFGNIVNVASLAGVKASGKNLAYAASKFAVVGMTKSAALEYAGKNIRINCVCPGYTRSALFDQVLEIDESMHDKLLKYIPMRRYGQPEEIAEAIVWLASEKTAFMTGQSITLDGGISL